MNLQRALPLALALAAPVFAQDQDKKKHLLRFDFKACTVTEQVLKQEMTMSMQMGAEPQVTKMAMSMFNRFTVKAADGGQASIEQKVTRVKAVMDNPMMQVDYDSAKEGSDPGMLQGLEEVVGQSVNMKLSDSGEASDLQVPDGAGPGSGGPNIEEMVKQIVVSLPKEPVAIGESWTVDQSMAMGQMGDTKAKVTYKLVGVTDTEIMLDQQLEMDLDSMETPPGMEITKATAKGKVTLDTRNGLAKTMNLDMTMEMDGPMAMTMEMKTSIKPASDGKKGPTTGPKKDAPMVCVISGEDAEGGPTATFNGQTVAFCCKRCKAKWDKMDDAGREKAIAKLGAGK